MTRPGGEWTPARAWTVEDIGNRPLTINQVTKMHRLKWAAHTADARARWHWLIRHAKVPPLERVRVVAVPLHRDRRSPQDVAACAPEAKPAIDGLVDAGVFPDDDATHVVAVEFRPPDVCGRDGMQIMIVGRP